MYIQCKVQDGRSARFTVVYQLNQSSATFCSKSNCSQWASSEELGRASPMKYARAGSPFMISGGHRSATQ